MQRLVKSGGRLVKHVRYYWLMLAESHLTRRLFGSIVAAEGGPAGVSRMVCGAGKQIGRRRRGREASDKSNKTRCFQVLALPEEPEPARSWATGAARDGKK